MKYSTQSLVQKTLKLEKLLESVTLNQPSATIIIERGPFLEEKNSFSVQMYSLSKFKLMLIYDLFRNTLSKKVQQADFILAKYNNFLKGTKV